MITAHVLVKNEGNYIWYSIMSVIDSVDRMRIWDMGSNDKTVEIIKEIIKNPKYKNKVFYKQLSSDNFFDEQKYRQEMLDMDLKDLKLNHEYDWIIVLDGDEIWWTESIRKVVNTIHLYKNKIESIVLPTINLIGDMYHYQEEKAGHYHLLGKTGHYNLRAFNLRIPGIHSSKPHGTWGWTDENEKMIQDRNQDKIVFVNASYLHATHLQRSDVSKSNIGVYKRLQKLKHEIGIKFSLDYYYPEVFFRCKPDIVPNVWEKMSIVFFLRSIIETPFRKFRRRVIKLKEGY